MRKSRAKPTIIHKSPIIAWIVDNQPCTQKELAEIAGVNAVTLSNVFQGKADFTTETLWKVMRAIAEIRPSSRVGKVVRIIDDGDVDDVGEDLALLVDSATEEQLEELFLLIGKKIFTKPEKFHQPNGVKSAFR